ncbi:hypothetical protein Acsp03_58410 [Actinomadura sp. NBRC 104412]|uniref:type IV secretory system conjugative DNA transfer family protein n=1 Tax=Actinomadura sp. NBRC 104412 TaxID=3032203 RepID=UPI0024A4D2C3|nr:TraM recognition domain-containing protein [Actinomadura sp. NBRC 104412]GLZ08375.1 hypothetical protein Acsp03_58410 [Actinomadura sp. NBRC 104412]
MVDFGEPIRGREEPGVGYVGAALITLALALALLLTLLAACAIVLFLLLRRVLRRRDWVILLVAGLVGFCWRLHENTLAYGHWLMSFAGVGVGHPARVPATAVLCVAVALAGCAGLVPRSAQAPTFGAVMRCKKAVQDVLDGTWLRRLEMTEDPITPRRGRRERLRRQVSRRITLADIPAVRGPHATQKARATALADKSIPLGLGGRKRPVWLSTGELGMHGCVVGSTGSGKTVTLIWLIGAAADLGYDVTVIDMKEDTEPGGLRDFLRGYSLMHQVPLQEIALGDRQSSYWFNALADMSADEAFDTIISLVEFDDAYWKALNRKILQQVVQLCYEAAEVAPDRFPPPTLLELGKIMEAGPRMRNAVRDRVQAIDTVRRAGHCQGRYTNVLEPSADEAKSAAGFGTKLTGLYDSGAGRALLIPGDGRRMLDVRGHGLTYIGLNSLGQPDMARILSSSALQRLSVYAAQRIQGRLPKERPRLIVIDEANFINRDIAMNMLARVRSAQFSMVLCTQGPTDWIDKDGDDWSRLTQNINWLFAMAQSSPESAEKCAEFLGMRDTNKLTERVDGSPGASEIRAQDDENFLVTPKELRDLTIGEGYLRVNKPRSRVAFATVPLRDQELRFYERSPL